jgi:hypothetical protein
MHDLGSFLAVAFVVPVRCTDVLCLPASSLNNEFLPALQILFVPCNSTCSSVLATLEEFMDVCQRSKLNLNMISIDATLVSTRQIASHSGNGSGEVNACCRAILYRLRKRLWSQRFVHRPNACLTRGRLSGKSVAESF